MKTSESIKNIAEAMVGFHKEVGKIAKSADNPFFKSKYAPLPEILKAINEPLSNNGLSFMQFPIGDNGMETIIMHTSGEWMRAKYYMKPSKSDPQAYGSVITYQRRYALSAILGLNTDEDDDSNRASAPMEASQRAEIQRLLSFADIDDKTRSKIINGMEGFDSARAEECIFFLRDNQKDLIASGENYNQGDIHKKLDEIESDPNK